MFRMFCVLLHRVFAILVDLGCHGTSSQTAVVPAHRVLPVGKQCFLLGMGEHGASGVVAASVAHSFARSTHCAVQHAERTASWLATTTTSSRAAEEPDQQAIPTPTDESTRALLDVDSRRASILFPDVQRRMP